MLTLDADTRLELLREAFPSLCLPLDDANGARPTHPTSSTSVAATTAHQDTSRQGGDAVASEQASLAAVDELRVVDQPPSVVDQSPSVLAHNSVEGLLHDTQRLLASLGSDTPVTDSVFGDVAPMPPMAVQQRLASVPPLALPDTAALTLLAALLCTLLRGARQPDHRVGALRMLVRAAWCCDDAVKLQRIVPYVLAMVGACWGDVLGGIACGGHTRLVRCWFGRVFHATSVSLHDTTRHCTKDMGHVTRTSPALGDQLAMVRCAALQALERVLSSVSALPPSEAGMFSEYVLPSLSLVPSDSEEAVRQACAVAVARLAGTAARCLEAEEEAGPGVVEKKGAAAAAARVQVGGVGGVWGETAAAVVVLGSTRAAMLINARC